MPAFIQQIPVGPMANFAYLLGDAVSKEAALVDPGWDADRLTAIIEEGGFSPVAVLLTHTHFDHVRALQDILRQFPVPVYVHEKERAAVSGNASIITTVEGTVISIGSINVTCHHTPGHTPGGQCFSVDRILITGDTLFVGACGRVDLPGSDPQAMHASLQRLSTFPDDTVIYPGHDYGETPTSTIGEQKGTNPFLREAMIKKT